MIFNHDDRGFGSALILIASSARKYWCVTAGDASTAAVLSTSRFTTCARETDWVTTWTKI